MHFQKWDDIGSDYHPSFSRIFYAARKSIGTIWAINQHFWKKHG
jgi:hypothetical protein